MEKTATLIKQIKERIKGAQEGVDVWRPEGRAPRLCVHVGDISKVIGMNRLKAERLLQRYYFKLYNMIMALYTTDLNAFNGAKSSIRVLDVIVMMLCRYCPDTMQHIEELKSRMRKVTTVNYNSGNLFGNDENTSASDDGRCHEPRR